jgi:hypothetical protein
MKEVMAGSIKSSKENYNLMKSRKNSINLVRLIEFIKCKKNLRK